MSVKSLYIYSWSKSCICTHIVMLRLSCASASLVGQSRHATGAAGGSLALCGSLRESLWICASRCCWGFSLSDAGKARISASVSVFGTVGMGSFEGGYGPTSQ